MSEYVNATMALASNDMKTLGQYGRIIYRFGKDGKVQVDAEDFQLTLAVDMQGIILDIVISIAGQTSASYTLSNPNKIVFSEVQAEKLKLSKKMNGGEIVTHRSNGSIALFGLLPDLGYDTFTYECGSDTLKYIPPFENAKPLIFKRVP